MTGAPRPRGSKPPVVDVEQVPTPPEPVPDPHEQCLTTLGVLSAQLDVHCAALDRLERAVPDLRTMVNTEETRRQMADLTVKVDTVIDGIRQLGEHQQYLTDAVNALVEQAAHAATQANDMLGNLAGGGGMLGKLAQKMMGANQRPQIQNGDNQ